MKVQDRQNGPSGLPEKKTGWLRAWLSYRILSGASRSSYFFSVAMPFVGVDAICYNSPVPFLGKRQNHDSGDTTNNYVTLTGAVKTGDATERLLVTFRAQ